MSDKKTDKNFCPKCNKLWATHNSDGSCTAEKTSYLPMTLNGKKVKVWLEKADDNRNIHLRVGRDKQKNDDNAAYVCSLIINGVLEIYSGVDVNLFQTMKRVNTYGAIETYPLVKYG